MSQASDLYDEILSTVLTQYVDRDRVDLTGLFQQGLAEMRQALDEKAFQRKHLTGVGQAEIEGFKIALDQLLTEKVKNQGHAKELVRKVMQAAKVAKIKPGVVALECACGACNSLDDYSFYLAPERLNHAEASRKAKYVGIGVELAVSDGKLEVSRVYRKGPGANAGLARGDRIARIDGQAVDPLHFDLAAERLLGEPGSSVEIEFQPRGQAMAQSVKIERQAVLGSTVDSEMRGEAGGYIGYLQIHYFQESTLQEVKDALVQWQGMPLRGIILDLRGNPGGLVKSSLGIAELLLPEDSILARVHSPLAGVKDVHKSANPAPMYPEVPIVVLMDGETASAAEMLAGALRDNLRATLMGSPSYGKGSIQCLFQLESGPGGLRLTTAKFSSPARLAYSGRGLVPDHPVGDGEGDPVLKAAEQLLRGMMMMR
jgi:carboxyl-terminal processing protease